jgi:cytidine deaminase
MSGHSASGSETNPVMSQAGASGEERRERLLQAARSAMEYAYAPYSNFRVGAALLTDSGEIFIGCNVQNAAYGMTNCAERTAIFGGGETGTQG